MHKQPKSKSFDSFSCNPVLLNLAGIDDPFQRFFGENSHKLLKGLIEIHLIHFQFLVIVKYTFSTEVERFDIN